MRKQRIDPSNFNEMNRLPVSVRLASWRADFIYGGVISGKWWRNYLHVHSFCEVCYVFRGSGTFRIGGDSHPIQRGDLFVARPGEPHEIVSARRSPLEIYFWAYTLVPSPARPKEHSDETIDEVMGHFQSAGICVIRAGTAVPRTLELMTEEITRRAPGYVEIIRALASKLVLDAARAVVPLSRVTEPLDLESATSAESVTRTAVRYLKDNLSRRFEVRDVAAQVHLSERQLSRVFQKITGKSILTYLTDLRIERASQLLLDKELPIKQVAWAVGYPDTHYFTTLFGHKTGLTPAAYRRSGGTRFLSSDS